MMRQTKLITMILTAMLVSTAAMAQNKGKVSKASSLEVTFNYQKQSGPGSNQYAVWIEDEKGSLRVVLA